MSINEQNVLNIAKIVPIIDGTQTITYDNSVSGLSSTTVQNAITENAGNISSINSTLSIYEPNGSDGSNVINVTGNITLTAADSGKTLVFWGNISAAITVTLPTGSQGIWFELGPSNYNIVLHSPINVYNENNTVICSPNGTYTIPGTGIFGSTTKIVYDGGAAAYYAKQSSFPNFSNVTVSGTLNIQNATTSNEAVNLGQADGRYQFNGSAGNNYLSLNGSGTLTSSDSGKHIGMWSATAASTVTLPSPNQGIWYIIGDCNYDVTITSSSKIFLPDGTSNTSYVQPAGVSNFTIVRAWNGSWFIGTSGRTIVADAVNNNEAVALGQLLGPMTTGNTLGALATSTTYTQSLSFTAPSAGYVWGQSRLILGAVASNVVRNTLLINGTVYQSDNTPLPMTEAGAVSVNAGEAVTVTAQLVTSSTSPNAAASLYVDAIFIPSLSAV